MMKQAKHFLVAAAMGLLIGAGCSSTEPKSEPAPSTAGAPEAPTPLAQTTPPATANLGAASSGVGR